MKALSKINSVIGTIGFFLLLFGAVTIDSDSSAPFRFVIAGTILLIPTILKYSRKELTNDEM